MGDKHIQQLRAKLADYSRYSYILLIIGSFFFMGAALLAEEKTATQLMVMFSITLVFLFTSAGCYYYALKIKKRLIDEDQSLL